MRGEVRAGKREDVGWRRRKWCVWGGPNYRIGATGHARSTRAHPKHLAHACDLGRVEAQRLVERRCALPSRKEGMRCGARCGPRGGRAWGGCGENGARGEGPTTGWATGHARSAPKTSLSWL